jgi:hypothetical protein
MVKRFTQNFVGSNATSQGWIVTANGGVLPSDPSNNAEFYIGGKLGFMGIDWQFNGNRVELLNATVDDWQMYRLVFWAETANVDLGSNDSGCFDGIIGLSKTITCLCYDPKPVNYDYSRSGLFLADLAPISKAGNFENCQNGNIWERMQDAIRVAKAEMVGTINTLLQTRFELARPRWEGTIGEVGYQGALETNDLYFFIRVSADHVSAGVMTIKNIGLVFTGSGAVSCMVYTNTNQLVTTVTLQSSTATHRLNDVEIELPMVIDYANVAEFYLVFEYNPANKPMLTSHNCGCSGQHPWFDNSFERTVYNSGRTWGGKMGWANWVQVGVGTTSSLDFANNSSQCRATTLSMYGVTLRIEFKCNIENCLCANTLDFSSDPHANSLAFALLYLSAAKLVEYMQKEPGIRHSNLVVDELEPHKNAWLDSYGKMIKFITDQVSILSGDCFTEIRQSQLTRNY